MHSFLKNNVFSISFGTSLSKLAGCIRQISIAAAFGVGVTYDAFNYAYIIPGFLLIIVGGINGPLHNAVVAVLTPLNKKNGGIVLTQVSIKLSILLFGLAILIYFNSRLLIELLAPNLSYEAKSIATYQLKILTPCIPLSGFIGLSFGALNSQKKFFLSSISPAITSLTTIFFILLSWIFNQENEYSHFFTYTGLLAFATLTGTLIQFVIQIAEINKIGLLILESNFQLFNDEEKRIFKLIIPASISSGLSQINVFIDMFFASSFQGAASGLAYGNFLIQAPLGILSNSLILPLLPKFSKFRSEQDNRGLQKQLISGVEYCFLTTIFLTGFFITFNNQIVELIFQRGAFDYSASLKVKNILIAYAVGIPFYLCRDLLVRTYYSIEKTKFPFKISFAGIIFNIFFDWLLIGAPIKNFENLSPYNFGVVGIILSTVIVNFLVCIFLSFNLRNENINLPNLDLVRKVILMSLASLIDSMLCFNIFKTTNNFNSNFGEILFLIFGSLTFFAIYFLLTKCLKVNKFQVHKKKI
ncbi:murein biosynthesis integral membrane protein MurJ [Prochlorococcus marinus]|nr:murein biosynthesis integral membrane protein MurJ [Prochlorococcus marinus]